MQKLNFQQYDFRSKNSENKVSIFDEIRKNLSFLRPRNGSEHVVQFLLEEKDPKSLINVEKY
jgi:hypothetical protein